ncbi:hypothetical protein EC973_005402 [Apophysomyces ossiformis]|uniref:R3H domain-containing protein n=1 Tax=Apophysomyces ossiformis TaxID=679940 RepID=A0A8H7BP97_9FUNG|nr:hypothetical protein EC973_005402 [Apophysomyces ossiformis]
MLLDNDNDLFTAEEGYEQEIEAKKKQKRRFWHKRDSLARRNKLLVGKEGSRRRQRWDNNHPLAILDSDDMRPPGYGLDRPSFHWTYDHPDIDMTILDELDLPGADGCQSINVPLTRKMRQILKRTHIPAGLVKYYEIELLDFVRRGRTASQSWHKEEMYLLWDIPDSFSRWIVHTMCQYYGLYSFSQTTMDDRRLTFVCHPAHVAYIFGDAADAIHFGAEMEEPDSLDWTTPEPLFSDYVC